MKFKIVIEEVVAGMFEVEADSASAAIAIAKEKYRQGEWVLTPGELQSKKMAIVEPEEEETGWQKF